MRGFWKRRETVREGVEEEELCGGGGGNLEMKQYEGEE
jgi:hypothetical protein